MRTINSMVWYFFFLRFFLWRMKWRKQRKKKTNMDMRWAGSHQSITNISCIATSNKLTDDDRTCFVNDTYTIRIKLNHQRNDYVECLSLTAHISIWFSFSSQLSQLIRDSRLKWPMNQIFRIFSWRFVFSSHLLRLVCCLQCGPHQI